MFGFIQRFKEYLERRRRDGEEIFVGSAEFVVTWSDMDNRKTHMICSYYIDGNGIRYSRVEREDGFVGEQAENQHYNMKKSRHNWKAFGELPENVRRVDNKPKGKLYSIIGGKTDEHET